MTDESQEQQSGEHVREKAPPAPEAVGEQTGEALAPLTLKIESIENTNPGVLWGAGSRLFLSTPDTARVYVLTHEQIEVACEEIDPPDDLGDQEDPETADDDADHAEELVAATEGLEAKADDPPALNAAARICAQLNRIADALGADTIPFDPRHELNDVDRVEFRLMDIAVALERLDLAA